MTAAGTERRGRPRAGRAAWTSARAGARSTLRALAPRFGRWQPPTPAETIRVLSASITLGWAVGARLAVPDPEARAALHTGVVLTLGYGHLVGAAVAGRPGGRRRAGSAAAPALVLVLVLGAYFVFTGWLAAEPTVVLALLAVATWHTVENDLALGDAPARRGRLGPIRGPLDDHLAALGLTALVAAAASVALAADALARDPAAAPRDLERAAWALRGGALLVGLALVVRERSRAHESLGLALVGAGVLLHAPIFAHLGLGFADVFAAVTGYHLIAWLVLSAHRIRRAASRAEATARLRLVLVTHAVPAALATICLLGEGPRAEALRRALFAPAPYLFWSGVHVVHTAWARTRGRAADQSASGG